MEETCERRRGVRGTAAAIAFGATLLACSPAFDWRETRPEGSGAIAMFPCRPVKQERSVRIGAAVLPMQLHSCRAGDTLFLIAAVDVADPAEVTPRLAEFRAQALANLGAASGGEVAPIEVAGATPNPQSGRLGIVAARPDGRRVVAQAAFFVKGLRLYQATVLAADGSLGRDVVDTFFGAIRLP
jgi:hypothetical protein